VFRNGGELHHNESWTYNNVNLEIVNEFKCFGVLFNCNGKCLNMQKNAAEQSRKDLFAISCKPKKHEFMLKLSVQFSIHIYMQRFTIWI
jgi:hypothetical protein